MIPGAALSIIATAILARLGGDFDHLEPWQGHASGAPFRPKSETTQKTRTPPLIVLLHGHKFNSAMWGRYIVSFAFAGYECVSVDYELHSPLRNSAAHDEGIAELAAVAARALTSKLEASRMDDRPSTSMAGAPHSKQVRALRPAVLVGHSLGGLVAAHMAAHDGARAAGLNVRGVIAISTPFDGVYALRWLPCACKPSSANLSSRLGSFQTCAPSRHPAKSWAMPCNGMPRAQVAHIEASQGRATLLCVQTQRLHLTSRLGGIRPAARPIRCSLPTKAISPSR